MKQLILGMVAHVDAGKTTLTESLLYHGGSLKEMGRVDHGTAFLDTNDLEKARGITIYAKEARFTLENQLDITLLDTPGHIDFSPEMERSLQVLDYAILVISATDGVESHTETVWQLLRQHKIPTFFFINKMDLPDLEQETILEEMNQKLGHKCCNFSLKNYDELLEQVALCDESLLSEYLETQTLSTDTMIDTITNSNIFPCYFGSALKNQGITEFLEGIATYAQGTENSSGKFGGKVFKITRDAQGNRLTHIKVTSGALAVKDILEIGEHSEKINEIRLYSGEKHEKVHSVATGTVCALLGLQHSQVGDGLGIEKPSPPTVLAPVLTYGLVLPPEIDPNLAYNQLKQLQEEDPALEIIWQDKALQIQLMGDVQVEILQKVIEERFQMAVTFAERSIIYRETLEELTEGVGHYEPLRHYAEVQIHLQPLPPDSGLQFVSQCPLSVLEQNHQNLILTHMKEKIHRGVLTGAPITDLKIILTNGRAHQKHTVGGDFREATYRAIRQGLMSGKSILLEPWSKLKLQVPTTYVGRALSDIQRMGGTLEPTTVHEDHTILEGSAPISQLGNYQSTLISYTGGRGKISTALLGYRPCAVPAPILAASGYDPLRDLENPVDSIFCKQGAGFAVSWENVPDYMHTETSMAPEPEPEEPPQVLRQRFTNYASTMAEDKALLEIFQRTYGKTNADKLSQYRKTAPDPTPQIILPRRKKEDYLLVDGYNVIFDWADLSVMAEENLDSARVALLNTLCNYQGFRQCHVIVVFDAYRVKGGRGSVEKFHNIDVVYTKEAETADMYIEKVTHALAEDYNVRVATSDGLEQVIILGQGGLRMSARALYEEVQAMHRAMRKFLE